MGKKSEPFYQKFLRVTVIAPDSNCLIWTGTKDRDGYGWFRTTTKNTRAHRWAYEFFIGPIPEGLVIDHLCRNPSCVNPTHMEPVTRAENTNRGLRGGVICKKNHCKYGHELTEGNFYQYGNRRQCRLCVPRKNAIQSARRKARIAISDVAE